MVTLETEEELIPIVHAVKDLAIKGKHRIHYETITVYRLDKSLKEMQ